MEIPVDLILKIRDEHHKKTHLPDGRIDFSYGYKGDSVPDQVECEMKASLRTLLMVCGVEKEKGK